jgi:hypothetical protein
LKETEKIKIELEKIYKEFNDFQATVSKLIGLDKNDPTSSSLIRGAVTSAGANAEIILKYILAREKIEVVKNQGKSNTDNPNKPPALNDFIYTLTLKGILPPEVKNHLNTIQSWRNHGAHGNYVDKIDRVTIEGINSAMKYFVKWFFEDYLKGEYADFSLQKRINASEDHEASHIEPSSAPQEQGEIINERRPNKRAIILIIAVFLLATATIFCINEFAEDKPSRASHSAASTAKPLGKEEMYQFLIRYFNSINDKNNDPHTFFANHIYRFYNHKDINPTQVDIFRQTSDHINNEHELDKESLYLARKNDTGSFWRFWNDYTCYIPSKGKYESCKVWMEFGLNQNNQIVWIKELKIVGLKFTKRKPV